MNKLLIKPIHKDAIVPCYAHPTDAGADLFSIEDTTIEPMTATAIRTGLEIALPQGTEGQIRPRSGNSLNGVNCYLPYEEIECKMYIQVVLGTVDENFRGEIKIITFNPYDIPVTVPKGTKLAQMVINKVERPTIEIVEELDKTDRGNNGFGSTGA